MRIGNELARLGLLLAAVVAVSSAGCFDPIFPNGKIACATNADCPSGFF